MKASILAFAENVKGPEAKKGPIGRYWVQIRGLVFDGGIERLPGVGSRVEKLPQICAQKLDLPARCVYAPRGMQISLGESMPSGGCCEPARL